MTNYIRYSRGNAVGFIRGRFIHDMRGNAVGQLNGSSVHKLSGDYIGELDGDMIVSTGYTKGNIGNREIPATQARPEVRETEVAAEIHPGTPRENSFPKRTAGPTP